MRVMIATKLAVGIGIGADAMMVAQGENNTFLTKGGDLTKLNSVPADGEANAVLTATQLTSIVTRHSSNAKYLIFDSIDL